MSGPSEYGGKMRKLCARCLYWLPPKGKDILCEVEGTCRYRPVGTKSSGNAECHTEACGSCEFWEPHPNPQRNHDEY
ncbi:hypothetical protein SAMN02745702_00617 [Desulfobaculum bizertense DSM 18034]|uniref:Uncharacterized protein n=1 Tax=Desulfobaculum bizertense DSM 18034 TaxID=1121442 RepID=A0A1T4VNN1_9BACT|nr:hypothetical protein SAMN02745702_00617 [Desulfobaculum bizertense DSM 18034]